MQNDMRDRLIKIITSKPELLKNLNISLVKLFSFADHLIANDVVPVVRCKDCKHCRKDTYFDYCDKYSRPFDKMYVEKDHYCSYGERKDDNGKL